MTDKEWEMFFELISKIINGPGTWQEKAADLAAKAEEHDATGDLEEFAAYCPEQ